MTETAVVSATPTARSRLESVHPRPQLARAAWLELSGWWEFEYDDADVGLTEAWMRPDAAPFTRTIRVPYPPESAASGVGDPSHHPVLWYRRRVSLPPPEGSRWILHFGAVDYRAQVWVNGSMVCEHHGGHTPFRADITAALGEVADAVIVVRAEDRPDLEQPRGKQHWGGAPEEIWYHRTSGIWQEPWLELVPALRIESVRWTPDIENLRLRLDLRLNRPPDRRVDIRLRLGPREDAIVSDTYECGAITMHREVGLDIGAPSIARRRDVLWSPEYPNLLDAELSLEAAGTVLDRVHSYVGLRSVDVTDGAFRLNGWPYYLRLVLDQGYWPDTNMAAPDPEALRRDVELIKDLGFNGVRMHQKVEDPRFLYWCDQLGLLVWEEMPSAYRFSEVAAEMAAVEWMEVLRRDHSHPSVVAWVAFNESWGVEWLRDNPRMRQLVSALRSMALAADGTRPVIGNDGWEQTGEEIIGVHDYVAQAALLRARYGSRDRIEESLRRVQPNGHPILISDARREHAAVVLSEFGGISLVPAQGAEVFSYGSVSTPAALLDRWRELFAAVLDSDALAGFCYTQFSDILQEANGMVTEDRVPKVPTVDIRPLIQRPPVAIPAEGILRQVLDAEEGKEV